MLKSRVVMPLIVAALALSGCASGDPVVVAPSDVQTSPDPRISPSSETSWSPPEDYEFTLNVDGGEANLYGTLRITVAEGEVAAAEPLDERAVQSTAGLNLPTYEDILDHLAYAREAGYDNVRVQVDPVSGRPVYVALDDSQSIDEERYYTIIEFTTGTDSPTPVESPAATEATGATYGSEGEWRDKTGQPPPPRSIVGVLGPEHCGWERATFLEVDWTALGLDVTDNVRSYVDNLGLIGLDVRPAATAAPPDTASAESLTLDRVPDGAVDSGYTENGVHLWAAPDGTALWLDFGDRVEQWPELLVGCS